MKKLLFVIITLSFILSLSTVISAEETSELPGESVYLSKERQEEVAEKFNDMLVDLLDYNIEFLLKESLTPVYYIDPLEYLETGNVNLRSMCYAFDDTKNSLVPTYKPNGTETNIYAAKRINYYGDKEYCFFLYANEQDEAVYQGVKWGADISFADHEKRIETLLGCEVSPEDVRLVVIDGIYQGDWCFNYGTAFYVNTGEVSALVGILAVNFIFDDTGVIYEEDFERIFTMLKERREAENQYIEKYDPEKRLYSFVDYYNRYNVKTGFYEHTKALMCNVNNISEYLATGKVSDKLPSAEKLIGTVREPPKDDPIRFPEYYTGDLSEYYGVTETTDIAIDSTDTPTKPSHYICVTVICGLLFAIVLVLIVYVKTGKKRIK